MAFAWLKASLSKQFPIDNNPFCTINPVRCRPSHWDPAVFLCLVQHRRGVASEVGHSSQPRSETRSLAERIYVGNNEVTAAVRKMLDLPLGTSGSRAVRPSAGRQPQVLLGFLPLSSCLAGMRARSSNVQPIARSVYRGGWLFSTFLFAFGQSHPCECPLLRCGPYSCHSRYKSALCQTQMT